MRSRQVARWVCVLLACALADETLANEPGRETGWFNQTEFSFVFTSGNSDTETLGLANTLRRVWPESQLLIKADATRSDTADDPFLLVQPGLTFLPGEQPTDFETSLVRPPREPDIEKFFVESRYTKQVRGTRTWSAGASWDRNEDAGILNRYIAFGGIGNDWIDRESFSLHTGYNLSYTDREEETPDPKKEQQFFGFRATLDVDWKLRDGVDLLYDLTGNLNLEDRSDYSLDSIVAVHVILSTRVGLRVSAQLLYNSEPALADGDIIARVVLNDPDGVPGSGDEFFETVESGGTELELGEDQFRKRELDTIFRTSLTLNF